MWDVRYDKQQLINQSITSSLNMIFFICVLVSGFPKPSAKVVTAYEDNYNIPIASCV